MIQQSLHAPSLSIFYKIQGRRYKFIRGVGIRVDKGFTPKQEREGEGTRHEAARFFSEKFPKSIVVVISSQKKHVLILQDGKDGRDLLFDSAI